MITQHEIGKAASRGLLILAVLLGGSMTAGAGRYLHEDAFVSGGDTFVSGRITATDIVSAHFVGSQTAKRQVAYWGFFYTAPPEPNIATPAPAILRIGSITETNVTAGRLISVPMFLQGAGGEARASIRVIYDSAVLDFAQVTNRIGSAAVSAVTMAETGRVGFELAFGPLAADGSNEVPLAELQFRLRSIAGQVVTLLEFTEHPLPSAVFDAGGGIVDTTLFGGSAALRSAPATNVANGTGLIGETITVGVPSDANTNRGYLRVLIRDLGVDSLGNPIRVNNAAGVETNGIPYVIFPGSQLAGRGLALDLEYYVSDRRTAPLPTFMVEWIDDTFPTPPAGAELIPLARGLFHQGTFYLDFGTERERDYYIQYADGSVTGPWQTSFPAVTGSGFTAQWIDNGPPRTATRVGQTGARFYRVLRTP